MNGILKVDPAKLKATANQFSSTSTQIKNATNSMVQTVGQLTGSVWTGEARNAYTKKFNDLNDEIQKIDKMIQEHITDLNDMATQYEISDTNAQQQASSLNSNIFA